MEDLTDREGTALVTGGAGFIGSHLCEAYREDGWRVVAVDDLSAGRRENVPEDVELVEMDVRSEEVESLFEDYEFALVNHHAAQVDVRDSIADPSLDVSVNVQGTVNLLESSVRHGVERFVFASSGGTVYGDPDDLPVPETHPKRPESPYGVSKVAGEHYLRFYRRVHGLSTVALRYANVYGPRQDPRGEAGVVAIFGRQMLQGSPLTIYGDGEQTRDFVHVDDVVRANLLVTELELPQPIEIDDLAFNVGTGRETSVNELARLIQQLVEEDVQVTHAAPRAGELRRSVLEASKLRGYGWLPETPLRDGLRTTIAYIRDSLSVD